MKKNLLTTGKFAKLCQVSKNTLFHYYDIDLFKPVYIDKNGYRYYDVLQYDSFLMIRYLHIVGMPLNEIKEYMDTRTPQNMMAMCKEQENILDKKIEELKRIKNNLHIQREKVEQALQYEKDSFFIFFQEERDLACTDLIKEIDNNLMAKSVASLISDEEKSVEYITLGMIYMPEENISCKENSFQFYLYSSETNSSIHKTMPAGEYLCTYHHGSYETLYETCKKLNSYATNQKYSISNIIYAETVVGDWAVTLSKDYIIKVFSLKCPQ